MRHFIEIEQNDGYVDCKSHTRLIGLFSEFLQESCLLEIPNHCHGLRIIVNPRLDIYNIHKLNDKVYWAYYTRYMSVSERALSAFLKKCDNIDFSKLSGINSMLIFLMPLFQSNNFDNKENPQIDNLPQVKMDPAWLKSAPGLVVTLEDLNKNRF